MPNVDGGGSASRMLGEVLRDHTRTRGLTQSAVAEELSRSQPWVSRVQTGEIAISDNELAAWGSLLGRTAEELWEEAGGKPPEGAGRQRDLIEDLLSVPLISLSQSRSLERPTILGQTYLPAQYALTHASVVGVNVDGALDGFLPEGVREGDHLLVDRAMTPCVGKIVLASLAGALILGRVERLEQRDTLAVLARVGEGDEARVLVTLDNIEGVVFKIMRDA